MQTQLLHYVGAVRLHRLDAQHQLIGNLLICPSPGDQCQHLHFTRRQDSHFLHEACRLCSISLLMRCYRRGCSIGMCYIRPDKCFCQAWIEKCTIMCYSTDGHVQVSGRSLLHQVACCSHTQCLQKIFFAFVHGEDKHLCCWLLATNVLACLQPIHIGHTDIHHHHIRLKYA